MAPDKPDSPRFESQVCRGEFSIQQSLENQDWQGLYMARGDPETTGNS